MKTQVNITLQFEGGPLDGSSMSQPISAEWRLVKYEHKPKRIGKTRHIYAGVREPQDQQVRLRYVGPLTEQAGG